MNYKKYIYTEQNGEIDIDSHPPCASDRSDRSPNQLNQPPLQFIHDYCYSVMRPRHTQLT